MQKVLLSSGGMDSFLLAHEPELRGAVHLFVNVGQKYGLKERTAAKYVASTVGAEFVEMQAADMSRFEHKPTGIIPFRNAELILCAAQYGEAIYLGIIADEVNSDKSPEFLMAMRSVLNISHRGQYWTAGRGFDLRAPFRNTTKTELLQRYLARSGINRESALEHVLQSVSCYDGGAAHCGACSSCFKRWVALTCATGQDAECLQEWVKHPGEWHTRLYWDEKLGDTEGDYTPRRHAEAMRAFDIAGFK